MATPVLKALTAFKEHGGIWIDIGDSGRYDDAGQLRTSPAPASQTFSDLDELVPYPPFALYLLKEDVANEISEIRATMKVVLEGENPLPPSRLKRDLQALLEERIKQPLAVIAGPDLKAVRVSAFRRRSGQRASAVVHFVNYNCQIPLDPKEKWDLEPRPARAVHVRLPLKGVTRARIIDSDSASSYELVLRENNGAVEFTLPEVRIYKIVELSGSPASGW